MNYLEAIEAIIFFTVTIPTSVIIMTAILLAFLRLTIYIIEYGEKRKTQTTR